MRREDRVQGPVKEQQPDGMSYRGLPPPPWTPLPPSPPPPPMFEADSQKFATAPSVPRGFKLNNVRPAFRRGPQGDPGRRGWVPAKPPSPFQTPPTPAPLLLHPWGACPMFCARKAPMVLQATDEPIFLLRFCADCRLCARAIAQAPFAVVAPRAPAAEPVDCPLPFVRVAEELGPRKLHKVTLRFWHVCHFLRAHGAEYGYVAHLDTSDVLFQADPFEAAQVAVAELLPSPCPWGGGCSEVNKILRPPPPCPSNGAGRNRATIRSGHRGGFGGGDVGRRRGVVRVISRAVRGRILH